MQKIIPAIMAPVLLLTIPPAQAAEGPYQKISGPQPGKCIFSTKLMPPDKYSDPAYSQITTTFHEGDPIHIRCFYAQPLREYAKLGNTGNTLRDKQTYYAHLVWKRKYQNNPGNDEHNLATVWRSYTNPSLKRERFELMDSKTCSFEFKDYRAKKYGAFPSGCVNLANNIRKYSSVSRPTLYIHDVTEVCVRVRLASANGWRTRQTNNSYVREPDYKNKIIAEGCFNYKMGSAGGSATRSGQPAGAATRTSPTTTNRPIDADGNPTQEAIGTNPPTRQPPSGEPATDKPKAKKPKIKVPKIRVPSPF